MIATYRLQLRPGFGFAEVRALLPYFVRLGVSHLYLSPIAEARSGSTHGYDVVDHNRVRAELGGEGAFLELLDAAAACGLGVILDIVPNHADAGPANERWQDVLAYGPGSAYAAYFDVEWEPLKPELYRKILLPFLGRPYGEALDAGEITLTYERERFFAAYVEHRFAIAPATYAAILSSAPALADLAAAYATLARGTRDQLETLRPSLAAAMRGVAAGDLLAPFVGLRLHELLDRQYWRLAYWKAAGYEINYRRFFYVNDLVALRIEDEKVFEETHRLTARLAAHPAVDGVRVDHVDGLFDPHAYLRRLAALGVRHIWVEKVLTSGETLPEDWPVEGTTGYEFLNDVTRVLASPQGEFPLDRLYRRLVRDRPPYRIEAYRSRRAVMERHLVGELDRLAYDLDRLSEADYHTRDYAFEALRAAVVEIIAALERYRTYLPYDRREADAVLRQAVHRARRRMTGEEPSVFDFVLRILLGDVRPDLALRAAAVAGRLQQYASVVMAKGIEDTAFYRYVRLAPLNEVGGEPDRFNLDAEAFHARARFRGLRYPRTLLATATHDHKRGEDLRARLIVLASIPGAWERTMRTLRTLIERHGGEPVPAAGDVYLFCQTLAALWEERPAPDLEDRLAAYMRKAAREAGLHTSWATPDAEYEAALDRLVRGVVRDPRLTRRLGSLARTLRRYGFINGVTQLILKTTTPGVPDFYQGTELLDLSLVDPDNRRPVDFARRRRLAEDLDALVERPDPGLLRAWLAEGDERLKLYVMMRLLRFRRAVPEVFRGDYRGLPADDGSLAYLREHPRGTLLVAVPRFPALGGAGPSAAAGFVLPDALAGRPATDILTGLPQARRDPPDPADRPLPWRVVWVPQPDRVPRPDRVPPPDRVPLPD